MKQYTLHLLCTLHLLFMLCKTKCNHLKKKTQSSEEKKSKNWWLCTCTSKLQTNYHTRKGRVGSECHIPELPRWISEKEHCKIMCFFSIPRILGWENNLFLNMSASLNSTFSFPFSTLDDYFDICFIGKWYKHHFLRLLYQNHKLE